MIRADIQALRALAVALVVLYHFWPKRLTGGYIGVDVFFVISGFLITSHLISRPPRRLRDLGKFWARRVRRLLPASFLVLLVTLGLSLLWAPMTTWPNIAKQVAASALYVENWFLAFESVDYLAADNAATPVQHFWSLSVEEQFYIVWPLLIAFALLIAARVGWKRERRVMTVAVGLVVLLSLAASIVLTATEPAAAYFISWTRFWELGIGGVIAGMFPVIQRWLERAPALRPVLAFAGLAAIIFSAVVYTPATPFPGFAAMLPVLGTAAVIAAAVDERRLAVTRPIGWRPVQTLGDVSYSLYLWHWPAVVLLPLALGHSMRWWHKLLCIAVLLVLSYATKVFVEDRFRGTNSIGKGLKGTFVFMLVGIVVVAGASFVVVRGAEELQHSAALKVEDMLTTAPCIGGNALLDDGCEPHGDNLITEPTFTSEDKPQPYEDDCWILRDFSEHRTCHYGSKSSDALNVALVGNSHAGHWLPALEEINGATPWSITTYLISECYTVDALIQFESRQKSENCRRWNQRAISAVEEGEYDLVVFSNRTYVPLLGHSREETWQKAETLYGDVLKRWTTAGVPVLVMRDTPFAPMQSVPDCVAQHTENLSACDGPRDREVRDPLAAAASQMSDADPLIEVADLTDRICKDDTCYSVVGGVIVYFDRGHLSATFSKSLAADVASHANSLLARARQE